MKVAIIGACGKLGSRLVSESLKRDHQVVAVCRDSSVGRLEALTGRDDFSIAAAPVVSDEATLTQALTGCDAVVAVLISVGRLKATELVTALAGAAAASRVKRLVFTSGEVTSVPDADEVLTLRQRILKVVVPPITWFTPYAMGDMLKASVLIRQQTDWEWTIVRAPTLRDSQPEGYRLCKISEITSAHALSRDDYAACLLDSLSNPEHHRRTLAVMSASD